jgi:hypothetical protein
MKLPTHDKSSMCGFLTPMIVANTPLLKIKDKIKNITDGVEQMTLTIVVIQMQVYLSMNFVSCTHVDTYKHKLENKEEEKRMSWFFT